MKQLITICLLGIALVAEAQSSFDKFKQQQDSRFDKFKSDKQAEYDAFRQRANAAYADFMRQAWESFPAHKPAEPIEEKTLPPVVYDAPKPEAVPQQPKTEPKPQVRPATEPIEELTEPVTEPLEELTEPVPEEVDIPEPLPPVKPLTTPKQAVKTTPAPQPKQIPVQPKVVVVPKPAPAPEPIAPVRPKEDMPFQRVSISYFGTIVTIGFPEADDLKLFQTTSNNLKQPQTISNNLSENALADAWQQLADAKYDITLKTALDARKANNLCDWAYMKVLQAATEKRYGKSNEAVLMQAFLMSQSGYRIRMGMNANRLYLLVASDYNICGLTFFTLDGVKYYMVGEDKIPSMQICRAKFDKEKSLSLQLAQLPGLGDEPAPKRTLTSRKGVTATVSVNKNLIDFFDSYPQAYLNNDFTTRWAAYANTPLDLSIQNTLYPPFRKVIASLSERDAVGLILNWVQTAFQYAYDDEVWGGDRAFFPQETLFYPYSDCEDRAILFSRLVRDIVGLDVVLLYYPGHLAAAVAFTAQESGDWLQYGNRRYVVCDPTYINAPVGATMPGMDNQQAKVIVLK
mgnify:CR=1 FL=1